MPATSAKNSALAGTAASDLGLGQGADSLTTQVLDDDEQRKKKLLAATGGINGAAAATLFGSNVGGFGG